MKILFLLRAEFGTSGAAASYMMPTIAAEKFGYDVTVVSISRENVSERKSFFSDTIESKNLIVDSIEAEVECAVNEIYRHSPHVVYVFGRPDPFPLIYNIRHCFPLLYLVYDVRSPLLTLNQTRRDELKAQYQAMQPYINLMLASDIGAAKSYFEPRKYNFDILPIGVNSKNIPIKKSFEKNIQKYVFVGSLEKKRKLHVLIEGFAKFSKLVDKSVTLDVIGDGASKENLQDLTFKLGVEKSINFVGLLPQQEVFNRLATYDCGIAYVPYERYDEAPSLKSIEYSAAQLPVIASDTSAHKRYNSSHGFEFSFFSNDVDSMVRDFIRHNHNGISPESIQESYKAALRFDWETIFESVLHPFFKRVKSSL